MRHGCERDRAALGSILAGASVPMSVCSSLALRLEFGENDLVEAIYTVDEGPEQRRALGHADEAAERLADLMHELGISEPLPEAMKLTRH
jgi:hypothetical protein